MGNLLVSLRAVEALVNFYAKCKCVLIIDETYREIMECAHLTNAVIYFPRKKIDRSRLLGKVRRALNFIAKTRRLKPVISIAIEGDKVSERFLPFSGCTYSAGPVHNHRCHYGTPLSLDHGKDHVFYDYEAIARQITGRALKAGYIELNADEQTSNRLNALLSTELNFPDRSYAIIHPCATKDYKQWPIEFFSRVADHFNQREINVVITGASDFDKQTIGQLESLCEFPLLALHNRLSLSQFIALMKGAICFIGNDTGPTHLAAACNIPTLALFGPTNEALWGPLGSSTRVLRSSIPCEATCLRRKCSVGYRCMQTLSPQTVIEQLEGIL